MRREVSQTDYKSLPNIVTLEGLCKSEVNTTEDLVKFFGCLAGGPYVGRELTATKTYRIKSTSEDVVFARTSGRRTSATLLQQTASLPATANQYLVIPK